MLVTANSPAARPGYPSRLRSCTAPTPAAGQDAPRVVSFAGVAPLALLADGPAGPADLVADTFDGLVVDGLRRQSPRETLRVFLATNRSCAATADLLTVHHRIQQTVETYGELLEDTSFELRPAFAICRWHRATVLRRAAPRRARRTRWFTHGLRRRRSCR
ncbi:hypothetical protein HUT19_01570 [Streptomyces sp. NA02950]|uniref:hypothetical protein n=1 Tax=Streptomyces sp. NA02950 TaxID=2742137 RepID=UPI001592776B|nr:hypothetical protein [Streptomyces sp. NA02950]QKV90614.1 hypothetical protein HUT19_01570 [Streptomyces sp. NA02950]